MILGLAAECSIPDAIPERPHPLLLLRANDLGIRAETIAIAHPKVDAGPSAGFYAEMPKKLGRGTWAMRHDRQLIALAKTHSLQGIADRLGWPITTIVRRERDWVFRSRAKWLVTAVNYYLRSPLVFSPTKLMKKIAPAVMSTAVIGVSFAARTAKGNQE